MSQAQKTVKHMFVRKYGCCAQNFPSKSLEAKEKGMLDMTSLFVKGSEPWWW